MTVLVTGATGFVGTRLVHDLGARGIRVRATTRGTAATDTDQVTIPNIDHETDWSGALAGVDEVVHLAARVHVMTDSSDDPMRDFRTINLEGTLNLAEQAARAGVQRFIYLSTIKVCGESTNGIPFRESDTPAPTDAYSLSKWEAEQRLRDFGQRMGLEVVIIRPPLTYGPGVKGNLLRLLRWIDLGIPLPFANTDNRRSLVSLENLVDFIILSLEHPAAAGETFLVADEQDVSTRDLICGLAAGMQKKCWMVPIPTRLVARLLDAGGKAGLWRRLWGDLQVDASKARSLLGWCPPQSTAQGLEQVGAWYRKQYGRASGAPA